MIVAVGLLIYPLAVTVPARCVRDANGPRWRTTWRFAAFCYVVGGGCRIAVTLGAVNPLTSTLSAAAPVAVGLVLLPVDWTGIADAGDAGRSRAAGPASGRGDSSARQEHACPHLRIPRHLRGSATSASTSRRSGASATRVR